MTKDFEEGLKRQVEDIVNKEALRLATKARDLLFDGFRRIIDAFYDEYDPVRYIRHGRSGLYGGSGRNIGLHGTYKKYYKNSHGVNGPIYGGIEITDENMARDYDAPTDVVLNSFLTGWHGPSEACIPVGFGSPYRAIIKYRDKLVKGLLK